MKKAVKQSTGAAGGSPNWKKSMGPAGGSPKKKQSSPPSRYPRRSISPESDEKTKKKKKPSPRRKKASIAEKENKCEESDEEEDSTVERYLDGRDCTPLEYQICMKYLDRQDFEYTYPIPDGYKKLETFLTQIRETRGYGLTVGRPLPGVNEIYPVIDDYRQKNPPRLVKYVDIITGALLDDMKKALGKRYQSLGVENLVYARPNHTYFLTLSVEEEGVTPIFTRSGRKNGKTVEVMFYVERGPPSENPRLGSDVQLIEWKLKQGGNIIHCTEEILTPLV